MLIPFATRPAQPMYWRFTPAVALPCFSWPGLVERPDRQPAPPPTPARPPSSPAAANRRTWLIAAASSHDARFSSRCVRSGVPVPGMLGDRPPVPLRQLADQRRHVLPRLLPRLRPGEARPQRPISSDRLPDRPPSPYPGSSSRLRFICPHKHMIVRRLRSRHTNLRPAVPPGQTPTGGCRTRDLSATSRRLFPVRDSESFVEVQVAEVRRARIGPGLRPGPCRQARWAGRGSRVNGAPQARPAQRDAKHR